MSITKLGQQTSLILAMMLLTGCDGAQVEPTVTPTPQPTFAPEPTSAPTFTLGQDEPGLQPQVFAPEVVSTARYELNSVFSPDGKEFYFSTGGPGSEKIMFMKLENNQWAEPQVALFSDEYGSCDPNFSPDGNRLYFISNRPLEGSGPGKDYDIWFVERTESGWSDPQSVGEPINSYSDEYYVSFSNEGTMYFASSRVDSEGSSDIYRARLVAGHYTEPENLGDSINSRYMEHDPFIAPDESYILFTSVGRPDGYGEGDIYISFRKDGSWTEAQNLGESINSSSYDYCPIISHDGKFFFYTSQGDIYWVDSAIIEEPG